MRKQEFVYFGPSYA